MNQPDYLALNPNALVPTIDDDGFVLWESNVIVRYLSEKFGPGTLFPTDRRARFEAEKWMDWQTTTLWPAFRAAFMGLVRTPPEKRDAAAIAASQREGARLLSFFDAHLSRSPFAVGESLTMGDIPVGVAVFRLFSLGVDRGHFENVGRWYDALTGRPGYKAHVMLPLS